MVEKLLEGVEPTTQIGSQGRHCLRLMGDGHIAKAQATTNDIRTGSQKALADVDMQTWNHTVDQANQLIEQLSSVHQWIRDDGESPSKYRVAYATLWNQYEDAIASLWEIDPQTIVRFRERVITRVGDLETRINDMCDNWDPDCSHYFEKMIVCHEINHGLMTALDQDRALKNAERVAQCTEKDLVTKGWCLWQCNALGGETIAVVRDDGVKGVPEGYPVCYKAELDKLFGTGVNHATLRLVYEAKRMAGAIVADIGDEDRTAQHGSKVEPIRKCQCGSTDFWLRPDTECVPANWLCSRCHPQPRATSKQLRMEVLTQTENGQ